MSGFLSGIDLSPNAIERLRRRLDGGYIDLTSSNPTRNGFLFPGNLLEDAAAAYWHDRRYQPDARGAMPAREAVAAYQRSRGATVTAESVVLTASTSEAYSLLFALLTEPGDNVLAPEVSYPLFDLLADAHHIELRPYGLDESGGWTIDGDSLRMQADTRTRAVLLVSPHNPTGSVIDRTLPDLDALGVPVIADEVFAEFGYAKERPPTLAALHPDLPVFTLNGISKMFALPDLKLGWMALTPAAEDAFGARLDILNDTFLGASGLIQAMLPTLFERGLGFTRAMTHAVRENVDFALGRLARANRLRIRPPDGGYYLFAEVIGVEGEEDLILTLLEAGVFVHPGYFYGSERGVHIMISCLTERSQLAEGIDRLVRVLEKMP